METTFKSYCSKRVSYIITTKNRAIHLRHCLSNIKIIKKNRDEVILIDGSSSDGTHKVVKDFSDIIDVYGKQIIFSIIKYYLKKGVL